MYLLVAGNEDLECAASMTASTEVRYFISVECARIFLHKIEAGCTSLRRSR